MAFVLFVCLTSIATAVVPFSITDIHQGQFTDLQAVECEILPFVFSLSGFFSCFYPNTGSQHVVQSSRRYLDVFIYRYLITLGTTVR